MAETLSSQAADMQMLSSITDLAAGIFEADGASAPDGPDDPFDSPQDETPDAAATADESGPTPDDSADAAAPATPRDAPSESGRPRPTDAGGKPGATPQAGATGAAAPASTVTLPYQVDGQRREFAGIAVALDAQGRPTGATVSVDALPQLQQRLARADYYESQNQQLYREVQRFQGLEVPRGQGQPPLRGMDAVQHYAVENARLVAAVQFLSAAIEDPGRLTQLALAAEAGDPSAIQLLARELRVTQSDAAGAARDQWGQRVARQERETTDAQQQTQLRTTSIAQSIDHWAKQFPGLTDTDLQRAYTYLARDGSGVFRRATPQEAQQAGVRPGQFIVDHPAVFEFLKDRHELVQGRTAAATTAATATRENEQKLAAARAGTRRGGRKPTAPGAPTTPAAPTTAKASHNDVYDAWRRGEFFGDDEEHA